MFREHIGPVLERTLNELWARVATFAPNLLAMLLILVTGLVVGGATHVGIRVLASWMGFDRFASRAGLLTVLQRGGITRPPSNVLALLLAWTVLAGFIILAIGALDLRIAVDLLSRAFTHLPSVLIAVALLLLGLLAGALLRRTVLIASVNAGLPSARLLASATQVATVGLAAAMALEHLGVGRQIIVVAFTIIFGGIVFALALALGLGGQDLAREALTHLLRGPGHGDAPDDARRHL